MSLTPRSFAKSSPIPPPKNTAAGVSRQRETARGGARRHKPISTPLSSVQTPRGERFCLGRVPLSHVWARAVPRRVAPSAPKRRSLSRRLTTYGRVSIGLVASVANVANVASELGTSTKTCFCRRQRDT